MKEQLAETPDDPINPRHYTDTKPSPVEVVEAWHLGFHLGQVIKYIGRAGKKAGEPEVQDLKKAAWYLNRAIEQMEKGEKDGRSQGS